MKFTLPISPEYVAHWGIWEAVREIFQNALDEGGATLVYNEDAHRLEISSRTGQLTPETLVLGNTTKKDCLTKRGKFGEGYKLALLVLVRLGHKVVIHTGSGVWTAKLEYDPQFNATVLNIDIAPARYTLGVHFYILDFSSEAMAEITANIRPDADEPNTILEDSEQAGRIYVGGLYVATVPTYQCGYSFRPGVVKLDRDRGMVDGFNLGYETSRLWTIQNNPRVVELLRAEAPDVQYVEQHASRVSPATLRSADWFEETFPDAVPVSNQEEIDQATAAGMKWKLVPETLKSIIRLVKSWVIPTKKTPAERLREFRDRYRYYLNAAGQHELDEIIESLDQ